VEVANPVMGFDRFARTCSWNSFPELLA